MALLTDQHRRRESLEAELRNLSQQLRALAIRVQKVETSLRKIEDRRTPTADFVQEAVLPAYYTGSQ